MMKSMHALIVFAFLVLCSTAFANEEDSGDQIQVSGGRGLSSLYSLEGKVIIPPDLEVSPQWLAATRVIVNYGEYLGFLK